MKMVYEGKFEMIQKNAEEKIDIIVGKFELIETF